MSNMQCVQYIKLLTINLKHRDYQWKFGVNNIKHFNTENECTSNALYVCEIKDFFKWIILYPNMKWVGYVTIPEDAQIVVMDDKIKTNKVILHEPLIPLVDFIHTAIEHGAYIHAYNDNAIIWASRYGHLAIVELLIKHGANIHTNEDNSLQWASSNGHLAIVELLIKHGAVVGVDSIRCSAGNNHSQIFEYLIKHSTKTVRFWCLLNIIEHFIRGVCNYLLFR